jgi:hypothetical protein
MNRRQEAARERADLAFALYQQMGHERNLVRLYRRLQMLGVNISLATAKRYSARYRWQDELARLEAEATQQQHERSIQQSLAMYDRHAQLARAVQGVGGSALQRLMASDGRVSGMKPGEIARLLELGLKAERQALCESSDRREVGLAVWNTVTSEVVGLFSEVNTETEPEARARLFARGLDRIVDKHLIQLREEGG